jgi:hypothetical protein
MTTFAVPERWTFGGMDLSTRAYMARAIDGPDDAPPLRGENSPFAALPGRRHMGKLEDSRRMGIGLYIFGLNADGGLDEPTEAEQARANLDALQVVLGRRYQQNLVRLMPDGSTRTALAECVDWQQYKPKDIGGDMALLGGVADFLLADPWFYGAVVPDANRAVGASPTNFTLTNPGTTGARRVALDFLGPIVSPRLTNASNTVYVECLVTVASTKHLLIDCSAFTALNDGANVVGSIRHLGAYEWMRLDPGDNSMALTSSGFTGATTLSTSFYPPYR